MQVFILLRERGNNRHSWSPTPPRSNCPSQAKQTSSCRELHPTSQDSKSNNSNRNSRLDIVPGVQLNHLYLEDQPSIAEGCANQGGKEWSWCWVRVDFNGPDLPVVAMGNCRSQLRGVQIEQSANITKMGWSVSGDKGKRVSIMF
jgi:hypothetical protein